MRQALDELAIGRQEAIRQEIQLPSGMRTTVEVGVDGVADPHQEAAQRPLALPQRDAARGAIGDLRQTRKLGAGRKDIAHVVRLPGVSQGAIDHPGAHHVPEQHDAGQRDRSREQVETHEAEALDRGRRLSCQSAACRQRSMAAEINAYCDAVILQVAQRARNTPRTDHAAVRRWRRSRIRSSAAMPTVAVSGRGEQREAQVRHRHQHQRQQHRALQPTSV